MHDLQRIYRDLQEGLSLDRHPVAFLVGAGCPLSVRIDNGSGETAPLIPDIQGLTAAVRTALAADSTFDTLAAQFSEDGTPQANIEEILSRVRMRSRVCGKGSVRGLTAADLKGLEQRICSEVSKVVRAELPDHDTPYHHLVDWIGAIQRSKPLELFTTNYDLLAEQAFEDRQIPFFDGFIGVREPFFDLRAIEEEHAPSRWTRLWKLHGSISWRLGADQCVRRRFPLDPDGEGLLIHPSELKYDQSRRMPYLAMLDRLRHFLKQPSAFLVTIGYSFADEHLNEVIFQGARGNPTSAVYGLLYQEFAKETSAVALKGSIPLNASILARDSGVVRGAHSDWLPPADGAPATATNNKLGDFAEFTSFLRLLAPAAGATHA